MTERDFTIGDTNFKLHKLDAFKQFHIARRIAPVLSKFIPVMNEIAKFSKKGSKLTEDQKFDQIALMAKPILDGLAALSEEDANKLLLSLLAAVEMEQKPAGWAYVVRGDTLIFQTMELPTMLQLAGRSFMYNLGGFMSALPQTSKGGA